MSPTSSSSSSVSRDAIVNTLDTPDSLEENALPDQSDMLFAHSSVPGMNRTSLTLFCNSYLLQEFILCSFIIFLQAMCHSVTNCCFISGYVSFRDSVLLFSFRLCHTMTQFYYFPSGYVSYRDSVLLFSFSVCVIP